MADSATVAGTTTAAKKAGSVAVEQAVVNRAAKAAAVSAAEVSSVLPTVVETAELGMEVPSKVVLNQKFVVAVSILGGAALGAGIFYGVQKLRERKLREKLVKAAEETTLTSAEKNQNPSV